MSEACWLRPSYVLNPRVLSTHALFCLTPATVQRLQPSPPKPASPLLLHLQNFLERFQAPRSPDSPKFTSPPCGRRASGSNPQFLSEQRRRGSWKGTNNSGSEEGARDGEDPVGGGGAGTRRCWWSTTAREGTKDWPVYIVRGVVAARSRCGPRGGWLRHCPPPRR
ncbi:hypothetical protein BRADI_2g28886v3 [Brachypodium distachyon]|uniref:Uncharacterized protein n=1 Tax=Brachypodium distachyon TaxID=15368 RepID=A0A2K2DB54_BRADI|nr:hypothetical protein BRADI_2g28886v3 [Brachypodium distachyon]